MERPKSNSEILRTQESSVYREIISDMSIPVCCFKPDGSITFINQPFLNISAVASKTDVSNLNFFDIVDKNEHSKIRANLDNLTYDSPLGICEHSFIGPDGQASWYICQNQAIFNQNKQIIEYRYIGHNFSQHHQEAEKLKLLSLRDELTGLYNRHFVVEELIRFDSERKNEPYSIIFCDLNNLKTINDSSSDKHSAGDEILKKTALTIRNVCRDADLVSRWGGDEFLVLLPETNINKATTIKDRILKSCAEKEISLAVGVSQKSPCDNYLQVIDRADKEMYLNKEKTKRATLSSI